jgi:hypothetical protein
LFGNFLKYFFKTDKVRCDKKLAEHLENKVQQTWKTNEAASSKTHLSTYFYFLKK